jgi:hypothetical protein
MANKCNFFSREMSNKQQTNSKQTGGFTMNKNKLLLILVIFTMIIFSGCAKKQVTSPDSSGGVTLQCNDDGNGTGKTLSALKVNVTYFDPYFYTTAGYPGYYIGEPLTCKVTIINTSNTDFRDLTISAEHEYYDTGVCERWWYPFPREADYTKGEALPGDPGGSWNSDIKAHSQVSFTWTYTPPLETCSGLDQTHVRITSSCENVILNSPEAGIFCPPPPAKN